MVRRLGLLMVPVGLLSEPWRVAPGSDEADCMVSQKPFGIIDLRGLMLASLAFASSYMRAPPNEEVGLRVGVRKGVASRMAGIFQRYGEAAIPSIVAPDLNRGLVFFFGRKEDSKTPCEARGDKRGVVRTDFLHAREPLQSAPALFHCCVRPARPPGVRGAKQGPAPCPSALRNRILVSEIVTAIKGLQS